jgi:ferritin
MLSKKIQAAMNKQINHEFNAAYNYLAMAAWFEQQNLKGMAKWMRVQSGEEVHHATKFFDFVFDCQGMVTLDAVAQPRAEYKSAREVFAAAAAMEAANTKAIHTLYALALEEKDYPTQSMLKWFIDEQVEEEKLMAEVGGMVEMIGESKASLLMLDHRLAKRAEKEGDKD